MIGDDDLRDCFAMFAMQKITWKKGEEAQDAEDCYVIADAMMEARKGKNDEEGIAGISKRRYTRKTS
jgi:hypothetical protein